MQQKCKNKKKGKNWNNLIIPHMTQNSKELGRGVIFCRHMWKFRDAYIDSKKYIYVKIICACVYASLEVTKGLFPQAFELSVFVGLFVFLFVCFLGENSDVSSANVITSPTLWGTVCRRSTQKKKKCEQPRDWGITTFVMAECFMMLNVADRRGLDLSPAT